MPNENMKVHRAKFMTHFYELFLSFTFDVLFSKIFPKTHNFLAKMNVSKNKKKVESLQQTKLLFVIVNLSRRSTFVFVHCQLCEKAKPDIAKKRIF